MFYNRSFMIRFQLLIHAIHGVNLNGHTGIPGVWTQVLDAGLWTLGSGLWTLDSGRWTLDSGRYTLDAGLWTLDTFSENCFNVSKHWTLLHLNISEQNQNPVSDSAWLNCWKFFGCKSLRTSVEAIPSYMATFRNSVLTLSVTL